MNASTISTLVARRGRVVDTPRRGAIIAAEPVGFGVEDGTFLFDADQQPVIVLWVSHWGRQVTVLTPTGEHVDIRRESYEKWLVIGATDRPRGIRLPGQFDRTYYVPDVRPGDRFIHSSAYSGPASNFRCDVICEITNVTDEWVSFITLPHPNDTDRDSALARRWPHTVERMGFGTVWSGHDELIAAWLPRGDEPWPFSDRYDPAQPDSTDPTATTQES
jgi:hypothetical protein